MKLTLNIDMKYFCNFYGAFAVISVVMPYTVGEFDMVAVDPHNC